MAASRDDIFKNALALRDKDRADLVGMLIRSLETEAEDGAEEAWCEELERRAQEIESGAVQTIPWETARERLMRAPRG